MSRPLVVVGAGGFGRETLDVIEALNRADPGTFDLLGVVDDAPSELSLRRLADRAVAYLGTLDEAIASAVSAEFVIGVGAPEARERIARVLEEAGLHSPVLVHPRAELGSRVEVGSGAVICSGVQVSTNVVVGRFAHLNPGAVVGHDAVLSDFVSVNPGAIVSGEVRVDRSALLGAGSVVLQGLTVGAGSTVGAAACVTRDVAAGAVVKGVPAR